MTVIVSLILTSRKEESGEVCKDAQHENRTAYLRVLPSIPLSL